MLKSITLIFTLLVSNQALSYNFNCQKPEFALMIDAGSTGSRISIFEVSHRCPDEVPEVNEVIPKNSDDLKIKKKGIHELLNANQEVMNQYLQKLFDGARKVLKESTFTQESHFRHIPIFLRASAGVRRLPWDDQMQLMDMATRSLKDSGFDGQDAEVVTGDNEGLYAWVSVNALLKTFQNKQDTVGIVEMGGESLQLAYVPETRGDDSFHVQLAGRRYEVYSHSYGNLGQNSAKSTFCENNSLCVQDCALLKNTTGDYKACRQHFISALKRNGIQSYGFFGHKQMPLFGNFMGLSNIAYLANETDQELIQAQNIDAIGRDLCENRFEQVQSRYPKLKPNFQETYCFTLALTRSLLSGEESNPRFQGLGFTGRMHNLQGVVKIRGEDPTWTKGFLILEMSGNSW